ncbi:MAG: MarR family winged helix-turn-helix transcriptional regulator [bacterium]
MANLKRYADIIGTLMPNIARNIQFPTIKGLLGIDVDLTTSQLRALSTLSNEDGHIMSTLARKLSVTMGAVTGLVDRLERLALVRRERDTRDRRAIKVWLTRKGRRIVQEFRRRREEYLMAILQKLEEKDRQDLIRLLKSLDGAISDLLEKMGKTRMEGSAATADI